MEYIAPGRLINLCYKKNPRKVPGYNECKVPAAFLPTMPQYIVHRNILLLFCGWNIKKIPSGSKAVDIT